MSGGKISVVVTTKNRKYELRRALDSVYKQTCMPGEVIVVDCSDDDSVRRYIESFSFTNLIYVQLKGSEKHPHSVGSARNAGIKVAHGEYIAILDSDDVWCENRIQEALGRMNGAEIDVLASKYRKHVRQEIQVLPVVKFLDYNNLLEASLDQNLAVGSATIYKKSFLVKIGMFNERLNYTADWELAIRAMKVPGIHFEMLDEPLIDTWVMYDSVSLLDTAQREKKEMFSLFESEMNEINYKDRDDLLERIHHLEEGLKRKNSFYQFLRKWLELKLAGDSIARKLERMWIHTVIIYGAGKHGDILFQDLAFSRIKIIGWIDAKSTEKEHKGLPIYRLDDSVIPKADAVIVTPYLEFDGICKNLTEKISECIIPLDILLEWSQNDRDEIVKYDNSVQKDSNINFKEKVICDYIDAQVGDEDYSNILQRDDRYFVWENLSDQRQAALRWYPFKPSGRVLEIGAGFGALTGALCDRLSRVVVTETNHVQADYLTKRYINRKNLTVIEGEIRNISFEDQFDYIIMFGHLETIANGSDEDEIYIEYLRYLKSLLKPNGTIILAVDNRYGVRMLCGMIDKYTHRPFDAIANYPDGTEGRLFTREQLAGFIDKAGFKRKKFYSPLTDYRMPRVIYTDKMMPDRTIMERLDAYYESKQGMFVNDRNVYYDAAVNQAYHFLANSYIIEMTDGEELCNVDYVTLSPYRGRNRGFAVTICREDNLVLKRWLYPEGKKYAEYLCSCVELLKLKEVPVLEMKLGSDALIMEYIREKTLQQHIIELVETKSPADKIFEIFDDLWKYIIKSSDYAACSEWRTDFANVGPILEKAFIELIPLNCFWMEGQYLFFDQEFIFENIPAKYILFRGINICLEYIVGIQQIVSRQEFEERYEISEELWEYFKQKDIGFVDEVNLNNLPWQPVNEDELRKNRERLL